MHKVTSEELFQRALKVTPGGVHSPVRSFKGLDRAPVFFKQAEGAFLTSVEDKRYIDFCQSFGPLILGHRDPEVAEEVHRMVDTAWTFGATEIYSLELAEWISTTLPFMEKLRFVSSGTEAVMSALRVARAATGRGKVLKFEGCYHGHVDNLLVKAGSGLAGAAASSSAGISAELAALTLVTPLDDEEKLAEVFQTHGKDISAVIIEPLPANYGLLVQRPEFLKKVAELCEKNGSLLIFDEVISGFRVGLGGMVEKTGIRPDLVTYGKIIGGGFPVGCYGGKAEYMNMVAPSGDVYQAGTLSANPIGMRAGLTTLKKMQRLDGWNVLEKRTARFAETLRAGFAKKGLPLKIEQTASLFWIHGNTTSTIRTIEAIPKDQSATFKKLFLKALDKGVYLAPNAYEVGFVSMAHSDELLAEAAQIIIDSAE
ncbi:glutamate-1-semialdehyde 2,1-aminomutase [Bdellovibrio svalbardensis]|uniref:Glutamate-1-semialdehyde 2,1-aminomutase n=1 Tax=Bdellovibrio svalbardensis TaxID=2972972 RepID=A0ABT6DEU2_9BACT|nr:glutamate-1-semialdehyde 2,1-aminomutase [Bdellovibrio svalbardensis]MDG0815308.1 glutamate-1-semialdehyde 2,1-aminomutase [Bdellovibrio svalbardensis]